MILKISRFLLPAIVVGYYNIFMPVVHADEQPLASSSSQENAPKHQNLHVEEAINHFENMPNEKICEILKEFDAEDDVTTLNSCMVVSKQFQMCTQTFYNTKNNADKNFAWRSCSGLEGRMLYYINSRVSKLIGLHINLCFEPAPPNREEDIDQIRFERICSKIVDSPIWLGSPIIIGHYLRLLRYHLEVRNGQPTRQHDQYQPQHQVVLSSLIECTANTQNLLASGSQIPAEWMLFLHLVYLDSGEFWLEPLHYMADYKRVEKVNKVLFAPFNGQLFSLRTVIRGMNNAADPQLGNAWDDLLSLEPMPTVKQLERACLVWCGIGNYLNAAIHFDRIIEIITQNIDKLQVGELSTPYSFVNAGNVVSYALLADYFEKRLKDDKQEPKAVGYMRVVHAYTAMGNYPKVVSYCKEALKANDILTSKLRVGDLQVMAHILSIIGDINLRHHNKKDVARDCYVLAFEARKAAEVPTSTKGRPFEECYQLIIAKLVSAELYEDALNYQKQKIEARKAAGKKVDTSEYSELTELYIKAGKSCLEAEKHSEAKDLFAKAIETAEAFVLPTEECYQNVVGNLIRAGLYEDALNYQKQKIEALRKASKKIEVTEHGTVFYIYCKAGESCLTAKHYSEANDFYRKAIATVGEFELPIEECYKLIVVAHYDAGLYEDALNYQKKKIEALRKAEEKVDPSEYATLAKLYLKIGERCLKAGKHSEATDLFAKAIETTEAFGVPISECYEHISDAYFKAGQYEDAIRYQKYKIESLKAAHKSVIAKEFERLSELCSKGGDACLRAGDRSKAAGCYAQEVEACRASGKTPIEKCYERIRDAYSRAGHYEEAIKYQEQRIKEIIVAGRAGSLFGDYKSLVKLCSEGGDACLSAGDLSKAASFYAKEVETSRVGQLPVEECCSRLSFKYQRAGHYEEAIKYQEQRIKEIIVAGRAGSLFGDYKSLVKLCSEGGDACLSVGDLSKAASFYAKEVETSRVAQFPVEDCYERISHSYATAELYEDAVNYQKQKIEALKKRYRVDAKEYEHLAELCSKGGDACLSAGDRSKAAGFYAQEVEAYKASRQFQMEKCYARISQAYATAGHYEDAINYQKLKMDVIKKDKAYVDQKEYEHLAELCSKGGDACLQAGQHRKVNELRASAIEARQEARQQIDASDYLTVAKGFFETQEYVQSAEYYMKGIVRLRTTQVSIEPTLHARVCEALLKAGEVCFNDGQFGKAGDFFEKEIEERKAVGKAVEAKDYKRVGDAFLKAKRKEAYEYYKLQIKNLTDTRKMVEPSDYECLGLAYMQVDRFSDAIAAYREEGNLRRGKLPLDADYFKRMGDANMKAKNFDLAKNSYDNRINALKKDGQPIEDACLDAQKACEQSPSSVVKQQAEKYMKMAVSAPEKGRS